MGKTKRKSGPKKITDNDEESRENEEADEDSLPRTSDEKSGCISPLGCKIGSPVDPQKPADAVPFPCSNPSCPIENRFMHFECCEIYEDQLVDGLKRLKNKQYLNMFWESMVVFSDIVFAAGFSTDHEIFIRQCCQIFAESIIFISY